MQGAVYCVYGREFAGLTEVNSQWEKYKLTGYVSKPSQARPSRNLQTFFVNHRPVKSKLLVTALEEAYRNQLMVGKFPACVLCLELPPTAVDVNVHPAKTEVKFLNEKAVFDCVHYGVLGALNKTPDRPQIQFSQKNTQLFPEAPKEPEKQPVEAPKKDFFRTMSAQDYKAFAGAVKNAPRPEPERARAAAEKLAEQATLRSPVFVPGNQGAEAFPGLPAWNSTAPVEKKQPPIELSQEEAPQPTAPQKEEPVLEQTALELPRVQLWRMVGELYRTYILVEQGEEAFLIDKHAAHERILFNKLKARQEAIVPQTLLTPIPVRLDPKGASEIMSHLDMMEELGFALEEFGENTLLLRQIPMDLSTDSAEETVETLAQDLLRGKITSPDTVRDEMLHTVACKAAIKAGWVSDEQELLAVAKEVMEHEELKYCPHGRPICVSLSKKNLERQFRRT